MNASPTKKIFRTIEYKWTYFLFSKYRLATLKKISSYFKPALTSSPNNLKLHNCWIRLIHSSCKGHTNQKRIFQGRWWLLILPPLLALLLGDQMVLNNLMLHCGSAHWQGNSGCRPTVYHSTKYHIQLYSLVNMYRGSLPYAHFGTWKKPYYMKFVLVVDCSKSLTNAKIPYLHVHKPKTVVVETVLVIFV